MKSGIYRIVSPSGSFYIGSAVNFGARKRQHFYLLRNGKHENRGLQRASQKYGIERLQFEPILVCRTEDLIFFEQRAIDILKPKYNACRTAGSQLGRRHKPHSIEKMSRNRTGKGFHSEEWKAAAAERTKRRGFFGLRILPETTKRNISLSLKGRHHADGFESRMTDRQKQEIIDSYNSGVGQVAIAQGLKTSHKVIRSLLVSAGIEIRRSPKPQDGS